MVVATIFAVLDVHGAALGDPTLVLMVERNLSQRQAGTLVIGINTVVLDRFKGKVLVWSDDVTRDRQVPVNYGFLSTNEGKHAAIEITSSFLDAGLIGVGSVWPGTDASIAEKIRALHKQLKDLRILAPGHPLNKRTKYWVTGKGSGNDDLSITFISLLKQAVQFMTGLTDSAYDISTAIRDANRRKSVIARAHVSRGAAVRVGEDT
jgi:hypothetical protein